MRVDTSFDIGKGLASRVTSESIVSKNDRGRGEPFIYAEIQVVLAIGLPIPLH